MLNNSKYGHRCEDNVLEMTLLRASYDPDLYPDQGPHHISYSLYPHSGSWKQGKVMEEGLAFNTPFQGIEASESESGDLPDSMSLCSLEPNNLFLSTIKLSEDEESLIVRFFEGHGKATEAVLELHKTIRSASRVNLLEEQMSDVAAPVVSGKQIKVRVRPHEVVTLRLNLQEPFEK